MQCKLLAHWSDCRATGMDCVPIVVETLGSLSEDAIFTAKAIGMAISKRARPDNPSTNTGQVFHPLTFSLWHWECTLLAALASHPPSSIGQHHLTPC